MTLYITVNIGWWYLIWCNRYYTKQTIDGIKKIFIYYTIASIMTSLHAQDSFFSALMFSIVSSVNLATRDWLNIVLNARVWIRILKSLIKDIFSDKCSKCITLGGQCPPDFAVEKCQECCKFFTNRECLIKHRKTACRIFHYCEVCEKNYRVGKHICGEGYCRLCQRTHSEDEQCFIQPISEKKNNKPVRILVFDFEVFV